MKQVRQARLRRASQAVCGLSLVAFVIVAGATALTARQATEELEAKVIASETQTPKNWNTAESKTVTANTHLSGEVVSANYVQFTTAVSNSNSSDGLYLTHLASYLSEDGGENDGFMPLSGATLEYTYTPNDDSSWRTINLSQPANSETAFQFDTELHLGAAGTATDTVYFRYYVTPDEDVTTVSDKVSLLMRNSNGETGYTESAATVNYAEAVEEVETVAAATTEDDDSEEATHVDPLGRFSFVPNVSAITSTVASASDPNVSFLILGAIMMIVAVGVFVACLAIYIPLRKQVVKKK